MPEIVVAPLLTQLVSAAGVTVSSSVITGSAYALTVGATVAASSFASRGGQIGQRSQEIKKTIEISESPKIYAYGTCEISGVLAYGNTKDRRMYRLILNCAHTIDAVSDYKINNQSVAVDGGGRVSSPPWEALETIGTSESYASITLKEASNSATAWSELITDFPDHWTANHYVRGITQLLVQYPLPSTSSDRFLQLHSGDNNVSIVVRGKDDIYDPRLNSGAGGTAWSDNGVLCTADVFLMAFKDITSSDLDWDYISSQADIADTLVNTKSGTEKRSCFSGTFVSSDLGKDVVLSAMQSAGVEIRKGLGSQADKWCVRIIDDNESATSDLDLSSMLSPINELLFLDAANRPNKCVLKYYSPERNFEVAEADLTGVAWATDDDDISQFGENIAEISLPFCPSAAQASRIGRRLFSERLSPPLEITTNAYGWAIKNDSVINVRIDPDQPMVKYNVQNVTSNLMDNEHIFDLILQPQLATYDPATHEAEPAAAVPELTYETDLTTPSAPSGACMVQLDNGTKKMIVIIDELDSSSTSAMYATYNTYTSGNKNAMQSLTIIATSTDYKAGCAFVNADLENQQIDAYQTLATTEDISRQSEPLSIQSLAYDNTAPIASEMITDNSTVTVQGETTDYEFNVVFLNKSKSVVGFKLYEDGTEVDEVLDTIAYQEATLYYAKTDTVPGSMTIKAITTDGTEGATLSYDPPIFTA